MHNLIYFYVKKNLYGADRAKTFPHPVHHHQKKLAIPAPCQPNRGTGCLHFLRSIVLERGRFPFSFTRPNHAPNNNNNNNITMVSPSRRKLVYQQILQTPFQAAKQ